MPMATEPVRIACAQMRSGRTVADNIAAAEALIREAAAGGARYVVTPEMTNLLERDRAEVLAKIASEADDPTLDRLCAVAAELGIVVHIGSLAIHTPDGVANRAFVIGPDGAVIAKYDKIHMFDVDLANGESWRESNTYRPGERAVVVDLPGTGLRLGLSICYDLRFPQLYRALAKAGANLVAVPAAFTRQTGEAHWHVLLRARAIECGAYVATAAQGGKHEDGRETYGHSLVVDPWGVVVAESGTEPGVLFADIDVGKVAEARGRIPALKNDRLFAVPDAPPLEDGERRAAS
jgi:predicted amidohydrolase